MGGNPTAGYLGGVGGPFAWLFNPMSGLAIVDWLFMLGLLGIGISLIFGAGMKLGTYGGTVLLGMMWLASMPMDHSPLVDDHLIYAFLMLLLQWTNAGEHYGLGKWWTSLGFVQKHPWLA